MPRKHIELDWKQFDGLCAIQCTVLEIAAFFGVSEDTVKRSVKRTHRMTFQEYASAKRRMGHIGLRRRQFATAEGGNVTMQIWLGKQWLGQADKLETDIGNKDGLPLRFTLALGEHSLLGQPPRADDDGGDE